MTKLKTSLIVIPEISQLQPRYNHIVIIVYFTLAIIVSTVFALQEIQIEGKDGWAAKLPTWKWKIFPNKPLTGYHLYTWLLHFLYPHTVFIWEPWSLKAELLIISFIILVLRLEDFLWFVLNPHFGLNKFKKEFIPWHPHWFLGLPIQYWISIIVWLTMFVVSQSYL